MEDLFSFAASARESAPLADRMRPRTLDEFVGQAHIVGTGRLLRRAIEAGRLTSSIFWGPPGTGKTTLASIIAGGAGAEFARLNAVTSGVSDVRAVIADAQERLKLYGRPTYLLLDECHRWSKAQSDSILPAIERGTIRFIGSTTENPTIAMTPAIVSRCRLFQFYPLSDGDVRAAVLRAITDAERGYGAQDVRVDEDALDHIVRMAGGDARSALNALELAVLTTPMEVDGSTHVTLDVAQESIQSRATKMDESMLYDMLSAFCKSMRGSDSDAALAWFARMVQADVDPRIVVRRVIVHASEDVGLANPMAMLQAEAAWRALESVGMPEARLPIAQAIIAVCESPKSDSVVAAVSRAFADAEENGVRSVPVHLRDTHYRGAAQLGFGEGYRYPHDYPGHWVAQEYAPSEARGFPYYVPGELGFEREIRQLRAARGVHDPESGR
ncbi:MAG TPA: replication-associated recombination protein A [Candidatus Faecivicinus avistercoris]|nr:replication-associated recombination protein A [Candidatus Faecivicinus avistercoris]